MIRPASPAIELTFAPGTDPDLAWAKVQNKLQLAMASLPEVVQRRGVKVRKSTGNYLMIVGLVSEDGSMSDIDLRDYAQSNLQQVLARVPGVGEVEGFGGEYAMRIWLNPDKLTDYGLTVDDVIAALKAYNVEVSGGQFGGAPAVKGQRLNAAIIVQSLLKTPEEFAAIPSAPIRTAPSCGSRMWGGRNWGPILPIPLLITTACRRPGWPSGRNPAPMRWIRPMRSGPR